jgi:hypothetical protein
MNGGPKSGLLSVRQHPRRTAERNALVVGAVHHDRFDERRRDRGFAFPFDRETGADAAAAVRFLDDVLGGSQRLECCGLLEIRADQGAGRAIVIDPLYRDRVLEIGVPDAEGGRPVEGQALVLVGYFRIYREIEQLAAGCGFLGAGARDRRQRGQANGGDIETAGWRDGHGLFFSGRYFDGNSQRSLTESGEGARGEGRGARGEGRGIRAYAGRNPCQALFQPISPG